MSMQRITDPAKEKAPRLALVSSGLGNVTRGFEISTARWFTALQDNTDLNVRLFSGGAYANSKQLWSLPRNSLWTRPAYFLPGVDEQHKWEFTYGVEQISFWSALNFELIAWKPDVVWVKDVPLAHLLLASRATFGLKYKLIFANGSKFKPSTCEPFDLVQQINKRCYDSALEYGIPAGKMQLLSNCFTVDEPNEDRNETRRQLGIAEDEWAVICVAAWNRYHKRIDYLIEEVAAIPDKKVKLVLCGTPEVDATALQNLATKRMPNRVIWLTVDDQKIPSLLRACDMFVLPSLVEGLGNALVEAALYGLPVVTHGHEGAQFSIQDDYWFEDLSQPGNLTRRLTYWKQNPPAKERVAQLTTAVRERFSATKQALQFEDMVYRVLGRKSTRLHQQLVNADL
jgi:1,2-diacylglycerol 3-alpha-glucosyltransferase